VVLGNECVLCVGEIFAGYGERVCAVCGNVWAGLGNEFVLCVGEIVPCLGE